MWLPCDKKDAEEDRTKEMQFFIFKISKNLRISQREFEKRTNIIQTDIRTISSNNNNNKSRKVIYQFLHIFFFGLICNIVYFPAAIQYFTLPHQTHL